MREKLWKTTMRSMPGPAISRHSSTTPPTEAVSRPAMRLSSVLLPQPEWPTMVRNSPCSTPNATSRKTQTCPAPSGSGKNLVTWSMSRKAIRRLLRVRDQLGHPPEAEVEEHPDEPDSEDGEDHAVERQIVPFVPHEIAHPGAADQHLGGHDGDPCAADRNPDTCQDGRCRGRQNHQEEAPGPGQLEQARDVQVVLLDRGDAERRVGHGRPEGGDEDHQHRRLPRVLERVEEERHPGERRDGLQDLDEGVGGLEERRWRAERHAEHDGDHGGGKVARNHPTQAVAQLEAEALVVGTPVIEGIRQHVPRRLPDRSGPRDALALAPLAAGSWEGLPDTQEEHEQNEAVDDRSEALAPGSRHRHHQARLIAKPLR